MPKSSTPALLLMTVRSLRAARVQRLDQVLGNAAQAEAAHHDRGAVGDRARRPPRRSRSTLFMAAIIRGLRSADRASARHRRGVVEHLAPGDRRRRDRSRSSCSSAISASSAAPISSALVAAMSCQMSAGLDASRVVSTQTAAGEREPVRRRPRRRRPASARSRSAAADG